MPQGSPGILGNTAHLENHTWTRAKRCVLEPDWSPYFRKGFSRRRWGRHEGKTGGGGGEKAEGRKRRRKEVTKITVLKHSPLPPPLPPSLHPTRARFRGPEGPHSPLIYLHLQWGAGRVHREDTYKLPSSEGFSWEKILNA